MRSLSPVAGERQRTARLIRWIAATAALPLVAALVADLFFGVTVIQLLIQVGALAALAVAAILSRTRHLEWAALILPATGWLMANIAVLSSAAISPLFFVSVNIPVALLAGALLGHIGLAAFGLLSAATSIALTVAGSAGLVRLDQSGPLGWATAGPIFALSLILGFHAFRSGQQALDQAEQGAKELDTVRQAGMVVTASLELDVTIQRILEQLNRVVPYDSASVQVLHPGYLEIVGGRGWDDPNSVIGLRFPIPADNPNTIVLQAGEPYLLNDAPSAHPSFNRFPHQHIRSWLGVPLEIGDQPAGMLTVESVDPGHFSERDVRLVATFADQVAIALRNAQSYQAEQERHRMAAAVSQIAQIASSSLDLESSLDQVARLTAVAVGADQCGVALHREVGEGFDLQTTQGPAGDLAPAERPVVETSFDQLLASHAASQTGAAGTPEQVPSGVSDKHEPASITLIAPMISRGDRLGALLLRRSTGVQPFDSAQVSAAMSVATTLAGSIQAARLFARTQELAVTDPLTGLFNRRGWLSAGERELDRAERYGRPLATLIMDLDYFKKVNDQYGHPVGDEVLAEVADRLRDCLRKVDLIGRYGGEEFMVLLPECGSSSAEMVAGRIRRAIESQPFDASGGAIRLTISVGVASSEAFPLDLDAMLRAADQALYAAKDGGRNQVWIATGAGPSRLSDPAS